MIKTLALASATAFALAGAAVAQQPMNHDMPSQGGAMGHDMPMQGGPMHGGDMHGDMAMTHDFVMKAAASDKFEVTEGKLASAKGMNPRVRRFGAMMVQDHTKSTMKIKAAVRSSMHHTPPPPMLMPEQERMVSDLRSARGRDFDRMYVDQQLQAHQMALDTMQGYASNGADPMLRRAANQIVPVVQHHIEMLHQIQNDMH